MKREAGQVWRLLAWDWGGLLCFQVAHKLMGFLVLLPLFRANYAQLLQKASLQALARRDLSWVLQSPRALVSGLVWVVLFLYYFYVEMVFLALYCERAWRRQRGSLQRLAAQAMGQGLALFSRRNLPLLPGLAALLPVGCWIFYGSFGLASQGLEYLNQQLGGGIWMLWIPCLAALAPLAFCFFFGFHLLAVERQTASQAWRRSRQLIQGRKRKTLGLLLRQLAPLILALLLLYLVFVLATVSLANLLWQGEEAASVFRLHYLRWSKLLRTLTFAGGNCLYAALSVSLFYRFQGISPPADSGEQRVKRPAGRRIRLTLVSLGLVVLALFSETRLGGQTLYWVEQPIKVVAHRGGAQLAPENTLEALEAAWDSGADGAEIDVRQTEDNVLVLLHDESLRRTHGLSVKIGRLQFAQLADVAGDPPIPSLDQAIDQNQGHLELMIELKSCDQSYDLVQRTVALIRRHQAEESCTVASMDLNILEQVKRLAPELKTIYITSLLHRQEYDLEYLDGYSLRHSFLTPVVSARLHNRGKEVYVWTVNTQRSIQWALYCQPDGVVTDNPYLAQFFMESGRENKVLEFWTGLFYGYWADPVFQLD